MDPHSRQGMTQLKRLGTLTDVIYALTVWRLYLLIPRPGEEGWGWRDMGSFFSDNRPILVLIVIGLVFIVIYWTQNNMLASRLARTDSRH